jgi:hypothetical protein
VEALKRIKMQQVVQVELEEEVRAVVLQVKIKDIHYMVYKALQIKELEEAVVGVAITLEVVT